MIRVPITAANNIIGTALNGKHIIKSNTVANGFFKIQAIKEVVTTHTENITLISNNNPKAYPKHIPENIHGKKCQPLNPKETHTLVTNNLISPIKIKIIIPISL